MKKNGKEQLRGWLDQGMWGLVPIYGDNGGNGTLVILEHSRPLEDKRRILTILSGLANLYQKDIRLIRQQAQEITGQRTMNPLPLLPDRILIPFRMRKPVGRDDGAVGYFFHHSIGGVEEQDGKVEIILKDGQRFRVMDSLETARRHISCAYQIYHQLVRYDINPQGGCDLWREWGDIYSQPATRGDIAILHRDMMALADRLKKS